MSGRLFKWGASITVAKVSRVPGEYFLVRDEEQVTELRIAFSIEKKLGKGPNTCTATISNLSESSAALFESRPLQIRLDAGFDGELKQLFVGDVTYGSTQREGANFTTKLQLGDGQRAYQHARVARAYPPGTSSLTVLTDLAKSMGGKLPKNARESAKLVEQYAKGLAVSGPSRHEMTRVLARHGMSWSFQDGQLQVLDEDEAQPGEIYVISQETGMVDSPVFGQPKKPGQPAPLNVKSALFPELGPGKVVEVRSLKVNGRFKLERVLHVGDTRGNEFSTTVEAVAAK